jgi:hypothetical protein
MENMVFPPGRRSYGPEGRPVEVPALPRSVFNDISGRHGERFWSIEVPKFKITTIRVSGVRYQVSGKEKQKENLKPVEDPV